MIVAELIRCGRWGALGRLPRPGTETDYRETWVKGYGNRHRCEVSGRIAVRCRQLVASGTSTHFE